MKKVIMLLVMLVTMLSAAGAPVSGRVKRIFVAYNQLNIKLHATDGMNSDSRYFQLPLADHKTKPIMAMLLHAQSHGYDVIIYPQNAVVSNEHTPVMGAFINYK